MINKKPSKAKYGAALSMLGGLVAFVATILAFEGTETSIWYIAANMLLMVLFFAVGGALMSGGPGSWNTVTAMAAVTAGVAVLVTLYGSVDLWIGFFLILVSVVVILTVACPATGRWIKADRN